MPSDTPSTPEPLNEIQDEVLDALFERSKDDQAMIVGSEIRQIIGLARDCRAELRRLRASLSPVREALEEVCNRCDIANCSCMKCNRLRSARDMLSTLPPAQAQEDRT